MADLVSPIVDIISLLWPCCARHTSYLCKLEENKDSLRTAMNELKNLRNDVQKRVIEEEADPNEPKKRTDSVSGWLQNVEKIEGEVEVILQKLADEQQLSSNSRGRCLGGCCRPPKKCWSNYKLGKTIAKKILPLDELKVNGKFEQVTYRLPSPTVQPMNLESTVGMESMFDEVWKHITSKDDNKGNFIIGIYGHGGVGKTTLLKKINNEICGEHGFDHIVMFVMVSKPINYEAIQNKIGGKLGLLLEGDGDESSRADKIFNQLRNKSFVILLDDIWERVDLQRIGIPSPPPPPPPPQGSSSFSSKVIFTTRSEMVCGLMEATYKFKVECLPWDKAWSLFQEKVGEEALTCFPRARELAKDVAKQCGGLPLALITIGRAMSTTKSADEWKDAITTLRNSASEFEGMSDDILPRLKLSYDNLRNDTFKSCFCYCALFPEDYRINVPQLIDQWVADGIILNNNLDEARCYGHLVIETLKRACLLESCEEEEEEKTDVKMHDIIRDLALWIVNDCKSSSNTTGKFLVASKVCERWRNAERIFWNIGRMEMEVEEEAPKSSNLRTLLVLQDFASNFNRISLPHNFFQFMPSLRVLDISHTRIRELPTSICELYELQYLNLSYTGIKELPIELRKLVKLKFLDLSFATNLGKIPPGVIADLSELQVLKLAHSGLDMGMIEEDSDGDGGFISLGELDRLKQLQEVTLNISTSLAAFEDLLKSLGELDRICTALEIESCENLKSFSLPPPPKRGLGNLICLKDLRIQNCEELEELILFTINNEGGGETTTTTTTTTTTSAAAAAAAAAGLPINSNNNNKLEELYLDDLPKLNNIVWGDQKYHHYLAAAQQQHYLGYASPFQNLHLINIQGCDALKDLTWVAYVESLKSLTVKKCKGIETIIGGDDDGGLEEEGASSGGGGGGGTVFSSLKTLKMWELPNLKSICSHALLFPSIERIAIVSCPKLKKLPLDSHSNINNTLQWIRAKPKWLRKLQWEDETTESKFLPYFE